MRGQREASTGDEEGTLSLLAPLARRFHVVRSEDGTDWRAAQGWGGRGGRERGPTASGRIGAVATSVVTTSDHEWAVMDI
jgi:hypothetical protein